MPLKESLQNLPYIQTAADILADLLRMAPQRIDKAPKDRRGIYGLCDHHGDLRYIGSTVSVSETFHKRIYQRHRTGSEGASHYFSRMYNTGRMWRDPKDSGPDAKIAKELRNAFIAEYCRAVWCPLPDDADIAGLEAQVIALAPPEAIAWNRRGMAPYAEPEAEVGRVIEQLSFGPFQRAALGRQLARRMAQTPAPARQTPLPPLPTGPFRFFALDVETANHDRGSICQLGLACVREDGDIETWVTLVNPRTTRWAFTGLHGIGAQTVQSAPTIGAVLAALEPLIGTRTIYQHSGFDRSAIRAACATLGRDEPGWDWQDSVSVARRAWPELRGGDGHGLASLKRHLDLEFEHHDAGEDARAAAQVVLMAESATVPRQPAERFEVIEPSIPGAPARIYATVSRGAKAGQILLPHRHRDGCYVLSPTRFERDYIRVTTLDDFVVGLRDGLKGRMSVGGTGTPSLIAPASIVIKV